MTSASSEKRRTNWRSFATPPTAGFGDRSANMGDVRELFPECKAEDGWFNHPGYAAIIASFGDVDLKVSDNDWQGSTYAVIRRLGKVGYLEFGWGSCSGCDALEACESYDDL